MLFQYYAWRHLQQTHQKIRWNPGNTTSLDELLADQVELWNAHAPSLFLICVGVGATQMRAKNILQTGVLTFREFPLMFHGELVRVMRQLVYQVGVDTRVLKEGDSIRKPEALNLLPPSLRRGESDVG